MPAPVSRQQQKWAFGAMGAAWARAHHFDQPVGGGGRGRGRSGRTRSHSRSRVHRKRKRR